MIYAKPKIAPLGENALVVNFGDEISADLNDIVLSFAVNIFENQFVGFIETVPAYSSCAVFYDVFEVCKFYGDFQGAFEIVKGFIEEFFDKFDVFEKQISEPIEIPVSFDEEHALDLHFVAETNNLGKSEVIEIFTSRIYRVFMLGFLPGFAYMGELDDRIAAPRKKIPRTRVPKGGVGIAGRQTGIYSLASPGGWQIIGKTDIRLFAPNAEKPAFLQAGDLVKFVSI